MTDDVDLLLNIAPRLVGRTVPGAPPSVDRRRRLHAPTYFIARPTTVDGRRFISRAHLPTPRRGGLPRPPGRGLTDDVISPHPPCTNPSVTAQSAATAPLSGEPRAWAEVYGVYASVYHDADTVVFLPPVRGGVPDAPRSRDRRAGLVASVRLDRLQPHHPRCTASVRRPTHHIPRAQPAHHFVRARRLVGV